MLHPIIVLLVSAVVSAVVNILICLAYGPEVGLVVAVPGGWLIGAAGMQLAIAVGFVE